MNLILIEKDTIRLNSQLNEYAFGKTNYNEIVTEKGILAKSKFSKDDEYNFEFSEWSFSEIKSFDTEGQSERIVYFCGNNILSENAKTLLTLEQENSSNKKEAYFVICSLLTQAAKENIFLPKVGNGGIIIDFAKDTVSVLFIPEKLFNYSAGALNETDFSNEQGFYVNPTLRELPALCFQRSVYAYKIICNKFPFTSSQVIERNADIMDRNFLPVEYTVNNLPKELSSAINKGLKLHSNIVNIPGKKRKGKDSEDLTPTPDFPIDLLKKEKDTNHPELDSNELEQKASSYMKTKNARIKTQRSIRRNTQRIIWAVIIACFAGIIVLSYYNNHKDEYTSIGLTSEQTIEGFFKGVNDKDVVLLDNFSQGKQMSRFTDSVANIFVIGKQRTAYTSDKGFLSPEGYFCRVTDLLQNETGAVYGITQLTIDNKLTEENPKIYKRKEHPKALAIEKNTIKKHNISYYLIYSQDDENNLYVQKNECTAILQFIDNCWIITGLDYSKQEDLDLNSKLFKSEYYSKINETNKDILESVQSLRENYPWLPTDKRINEELNKIEQELLNPYDMMNF